jgi:AcrR family transcriptional regulator
VNTLSSSSRYDRKREQILQAATAIINERGASAMTLRDVGEAVQLRPATLSYYFKGKDQLAIAVFEERLRSLEDMISQAERVNGVEKRVEAILEPEISRLGRVLRGIEPALGALPSSNEGPEYAPIIEQLNVLFRRIDGLFGQPANEEERLLQGARSYMLIGTLFYLSTWIVHYPVDEFPRIAARLMDILRAGIAASKVPWNPKIFVVDDPDEGGGPEAAKQEFLRAATRLMNVSGYLGTSVDSIAEELNVTKGSFYHHLESKDELIRQCIRANFRRIARAIRKANAAGGSCLDRVSSAMATVLNLQFHEEWPLLRSTAFSSLPSPLRKDVTTGSNRIALRFAGMLADGIADRSIRPIDPMIAAHVINSALYSALGLRGWSAQLPIDKAIALYASTVTRGILAAES